MEDDYPNVSPSGMPLSSMKAMHFLKADNSDPRKAIDLFIEGLPHNPYLYMTETFLGYAYDVVGDNEKGIYYTKMAFENAPNDVIHFGNYINSLYESKDSISMRNAYKSIPKDFKTLLHDEIYLLVMSGLNDGSEFTLDGIEIDYQAGNDKLKRGYYFSKVGTEKVIDANTSYVLAMEYFNIENYDEAIKLFLQAAELNPYELVYLENAANAYMKIGKDNEALVLLNKLVNEFDAKSPKVFYLRGLLYYDFGDKVKGCENLKIARDSGLLGSTIYNRFCLE
jgi:tetratricopeptide (TPR) repeat protein